MPAGCMVLYFHYLSPVYCPESQRHYLYIVFQCVIPAPEALFVNSTRYTRTAEDCAFSDLAPLISQETVGKYLIKP